MTNFVGRLGVTLGLNSAEFTRGIENAKTELNSLGSKVKEYSAVAAGAFAAATAALTAATAAAVRYADEIADVAAANDVAISSIIQLRNALASSGGEASNASKFLSSFTQFVDKAADGSFEAQKTLKALGISLEDLRILNMDELFRKAAGGLAEMSDTVSRNAKGMEVFGKAAKGVDLVGFNDQLVKTTGLAKEHEAGIKAAADAYDNLAEISRRAMESLASKVGPTFKFLTDELKKLTLEGTKFTESDLFRMLIPQIRYGQRRQGEEAPTPGMSASEVDSMMANRPASNAGPVRQVTPGIDKKAEDAEKKRIELIVKRFKAEEEARAQLQQGQREMDEYNTRQGELRIQQDEEMFRRRIRAMLEEEAQREQAQREMDEYNDQQQQKYLANLEQRRQQESRNAAEMYELIEESNRALAERENVMQRANIASIKSHSLEAENISRQKIMLDLMDRGRYMKANELQLTQEMFNLDWKYADLKKQIDENELLTQEAKAQAIKRLIELQNQEIELAGQRFQLAQKYQYGTFGEGFADAMKMSMQNAATAFQSGQQAFQSVIGNMESAITRFVQTGKLSFKDLAKSIIADLIAIQMRAQATALFSSMLGSILGPKMAYSSATSFAMSAPQGWLGFADGGDPPVNQPSIVGERGPELFVPKTAGTIVPNHQLASMMGSSPAVVYNGPVIQNMSAIDTQSGLEFLVRNKQAVWAANQSAQRSLPMSR